jgi:hypothetical protein
VANPDPSPSTRFGPGNAANPGGRPKGRSLTAILRDALDSESPEHPGRTVGEVLVERLLTLTRDDRRAIKDVFDRTEGRPVQSVHLSADDSRAARLRAFLADDDADTADPETAGEGQTAGG